MAAAHRTLARSLCVVHPETVTADNCVQVVTALQRIAVENGDKAAAEIERLGDLLAEAIDQRQMILDALADANRSMAKLLVKLAGIDDAEGAPDG